MGWWSATVMGGDTPCDYIYDLERAAGLDSMDEDLKQADVKKAINKNLDKVFKAAKKMDDEDDGTDYAGIMAQVLGYFIITNGAKMTDEIRQFVIDGIKKDDWAKDDSERKKFMTHFKGQISRYKNAGSERGVRVAHEGLFEAMAKHIKKGKKGLVNKNR